MTFLNSTLWWGLLAVALPLLIHLFSRRRHPLIDFSTLRFLKRLQRQQMRRLRLRQWLLLLLRTLAVLCIALAFLRPALRGEAGLAALSAGRISVAIILDASASMQAKHSSGSCFQEAKQAADAILSTLNRGDRALLVAAKKKAELLSAQPLDDTEVLRRLLSEAEVWDGEADLEAAVQLANQVLHESQDFRREIYVISDFADAPDLRTPPADASLFFVPITPETRENLCVKRARVVSEILEANQPVELEITLANHGERLWEDVYFSVFVNDTRVAEDVVTIAGGGEITRNHQLLLPQSGLQEGVVQIEAQDAISLDNRAYFCFALPEQIRVLLVADPSAGKSIRLALTPVAPEPGLITLQQASYADWDAQSLTQLDVIILTSPTALTEGQASRLQHFVEGGGGLLLLPGSRTDLAAANRLLLARLGTAQWGERLGQAGKRDQFLTWQTLDLNAPLLKGIFTPGSDPDAPQFYLSLRFLGSEGETSIRLANGQPFLSEYSLGKGRIMLCASSPESEWSNWALKGIFAPLMHRITLRLAGRFKENCQMLQVGDDLEIRLGAQRELNNTPDGDRSFGAQEAVAQLTFPSGETLRLLPTAKGSTAAFWHPLVNPAGLFRLQIGTTEQRIAVNPPEGESDLQTVPLREIYPDWFAAGARVAAPEALAQTVRDSRYGKELWKSLLIMGVILLTVESLLGSAFKKSDRESDATDVKREIS
ncbi:MAG: BatA domain-containing protein [bacterium]